MTIKHSCPNFKVIGSYSQVNENEILFLSNRISVLSSYTVLNNYAGVSHFYSVVFSEWLSLGLTYLVLDSV